MPMLIKQSRQVAVKAALQGRCPCAVAPRPQQQQHTGAPTTTTMAAAALLAAREYTGGTQSLTSLQRLLPPAIFAYGQVSPNQHTLRLRRQQRQPAHGLSLLSSHGLPAHLAATMPTPRPVPWTAHSCYSKLTNAFVLVKFASCLNLESCLVVVGFSYFPLPTTQFQAKVSPRILDAVRLGHRTSCVNCSATNPCVSCSWHFVAGGNVYWLCMNPSTHCCRRWSHQQRARCVLCCG